METKQGYKYLILAQIVLALIFIAIALYWKEPRKENPRVRQMLDSIQMLSKFKDSLQVELDEERHNKKIRSEQRKESIAKKYENTSLVFTVTNIDTLKNERIRVIARLDKRKPPYRTKDNVLP